MWWWGRVRDRFAEWLVWKRLFQKKTLSPRLRLLRRDFDRAFMRALAVPLPFVV